MAIPLIDDLNWKSICLDIDQREEQCGTMPRSYLNHPVGSLPYGSAVPSGFARIPMEEWPDRIADQLRAKSSLYHVWQDSGLGVWDQGSLNYCHAYSAVMGNALARHQQGLPMVNLSPSSVGAPVTGFTNNGAYIHDDLKQMVDVGVASIDFVPMATTRKDAFKSGWKADAAKHRIVEFDDITPRDFVLHCSMLLQNKPVCVGLNYWRHAVTDLVVVDLNNGRKAIDWLRYAILFLNSWGPEWGDGGFAQRTGQKALADAIYSIRQSSL
jgi:hypothetical protein